VSLSFGSPERESVVVVREAPVSVPAPPPADLAGLDDELSMLVSGYQQGYFPMAPSRRARRVRWYTADPRCVVPLEPGRLALARSLRSAVRRPKFVVTGNRAFQAVVRLCATVRRVEGGTWINDWIIDRYTELHRRGLAHSVEAWVPEAGVPGSGAGGGGGGGWRLVGGLYGVHLGGAFFGESMFSLPAHGGTDASKVCFVHLVRHLREQGFALLDSQMANHHMLSLGAVEIPAGAYLQALGTALLRDARWDQLRAEWTEQAVSGAWI
jgi:leucyl/phenylalanyl-tRNA--protein transferase